jgi:hypothetical protein
MGKKCVVAYLRYNPGIFLWALRKKHEKSFRLFGVPDELEPGNS